MEVAQSPGQVSQEGPPQDGIWCQGGRRGREAITSSTFLDGEPQQAFFPGLKEVPQVNTAQRGQGRATAGHSSGPGNSHDCSVLLPVSQLLREGGSVGGGGGEKEGGGGRRREVNRRPKRAPVPCVQRTPAASGPRWVAVCVEMKLGGEGREGRVSTHF